MDRQVLPRAVAMLSGPADWRDALNIISPESPEQVCEIVVCDFVLPLLFDNFTCGICSTLFVFVNM